MIKLYGYWRSTAAYRVRIALNLLSIKYQSVSVHLVKDGGEQHHQSYDEINPTHLVPTLIDGDVVLNQSLAIIEYLDDAYGEHQLLPKDVVARAHVRAMAQDIACDIHPLNNLRVIQHLDSVANFEGPQKAQWMDHWMQVGFLSLERKLAQHATEFCVGDTPGLADACLVAQLYNARRFNVDLSLYPQILKIEKNCQALEAFKLAHPDNQPDAT